MTEPLYLPPGAPRPPYHPFANLFPVMGTEEQAELAASIKTKGQIEPVVLHRGFVLDGRNRIEACAIAGVGVRCEQFSGTDRQALDFVIALNLERRHLTTSQRAMIAARLATLRLGDNQHSGKPAGQGELLSSPACGGGAGRSEDGGTGEEREAAQNCAGVGDGAATTFTRASEQAADTRPHPDPLPQAGEGAEAPVAGEALVSQDQAADALNVSRRSVQHAATVRDQGAAELQDAVTKGDLAVSVAAEIAELPIEKQREVVAAADPKAVLAAAKEIRAERAKEKREQRLEKLRTQGAGAGPLDRGKRYVKIYADPPWRFEPYSRDSGMEKSPDNHYPTMTTDEIAALPVPAIATDAAVLFLWATVPMLPDALRVMTAWGFDYKSHCIWDKESSGTGFWFRNRHELLLVGTRGDMPGPGVGGQYPSVIAEKAGAHSVKPLKFVNMIEHMFPADLPAIELFRRGPSRPGWDAWGDGVTAELSLSSPACGGGAERSEGAAGAQPAGGQRHEHCRRG